MTEEANVTARPKFTLVQFTRHTRVGLTIYGRGEIVGFPPEQAERLIKSGHARSSLDAVEEDDLQEPPIPLPPVADPESGIESPPNPETEDDPKAPGRLDKMVRSMKRKSRK